MRAVEIARPGGPDVLRLVRRPVPRPGSGEVRIRVAAAGVNRPDLLQREGRYPPPEGAGDLPGLEVAGRVDALGVGVTGWSVGDPVCALLAAGGYAGYAIAPGPQVLPIPGGMGLVEAAAVPETFFTVWDNVFVRGRLTAGETILVQGGSGGIGTTAIQLAKAFGARVIATAGTARKRAAIEALGADHALDYAIDDIGHAVARITGGSGVDVVLDVLGGPWVDRHLRILGTEGRLVVIGLLAGREAEIDLARLVGRRLSIHGSVLRSRTPEEKGEIAAALLTRVWPLLAAGSVRPVIDATFDLEDAARAHERLEARDHVGKIVLSVGDET